jgi:hypothetical protein
MLTRSCTIASKNKQTFISFHNIVLHNLVSKPSFHFIIVLHNLVSKPSFHFIIVLHNLVSKASFHYTRSYILVNLQKLKQNTLFLLFHFFCIIMLRNCMIIDAKTKYFSILKSTAKSSNLEFSLVFHFASIAFRLPASLPSSTLSFTVSLPSFLPSAFATSSAARIASHSI